MVVVCVVEECWWRVHLVDLQGSGTQVWVGHLSTDPWLGLCMLTGFEMRLVFRRLPMVPGGFVVSWVSE
jgi:hypothetical protein